MAATRLLFATRREFSARWSAILALALLVTVLPAASRTSAADPLFAIPPGYATGIHPQSVAIGDLDGDGLGDMVVANIGTESSPGHTATVLHGIGYGRFEVSGVYSTGLQPCSVALADLNRDGHLDAVIADAGSNMVTVLLGRGDGSFRSRTDFSAGSYAYAVAIADLDADGIPDLVVASYFNAVSVLMGRGDGTFASRRPYTTGTWPYGVAVADLNRDGRPDIVATNFMDNTASVLLGAGDGTFGARTDFQTGNGPWAVAVADLNGDGNPDLAVTNSADNTVSVLPGRGDGSFGPRRDFPTGASPYSVVIGDLDWDGKADLAVASGDGLTLLAGAGDGSFAARSDWVTGVDPASVAIGDLNGDHEPDLAVANCGSGTVSVMFSTGGHQWAGVGDGPAAGLPLGVRAWPNPMTNAAVIGLSLPAREGVRVCVFDLSGRLVSTLAVGTRPAGRSEVRWDLRTEKGARAQAGVYLVELRAGIARAVSRVVVLP